MNILVADDSEIYRRALKLYMQEHWSEAVIYEASTMDKVVEDVFDVQWLIDIRCEYGRKWINRGFRE